MHRKHSLARMILATVAALSLTPLIVAIDAQAQIAFSSNRDGPAHVIHGWPTSEIYVMNADGRNQRRLTNNRADDWSPSWSPDGRRIAFISERDGHAHPRVPGWFTSEIYVMDADGGNQQNLTNHPSDDRSPSWSPDGTRIVFESDRDNDRGHNIEIYVMDADGSNQLTSLTISLRTGIPHGHRMVSALPSVPVERGTLYTTWISLMKST